jgi:predicted Zn-dependent protease
VPDPRPDPLVSIQRLIDHGHADDALAQLDPMAAAVPVPAGVNRLRGLALYSQDKLLSAEQAFAAAMTDDPADTAAERMRGITLYRLGRPAAAIPLLEAAAKATQQPGQRTDGPVDPEYVLALCYTDTRRYDDARHAFATQYGFPPDSAAAYLLAARLMLRREFLPVARQFALKALELSPQLPLAHRLVGEIELADNHLEEAEAEFEKERQSNPLDPVTYSRLGDTYVRQGKFEKARASLQEAVLLDPSSTGPFILLGKVLLKQQDAAGAMGYLEHARDMDPQNYMTHSLLGQAYRQMGRQEDARSETAMAEKLQAETAPKLGNGK